MKKAALLLLLFGRGSVLAFFDGALKVLDAFAETLAEVGQLARSKNQEGNAEQE